MSSRLYFFIHVPFLLSSSVLLRSLLLVEHWGGPRKVEVVVDVVLYIGWDGDRRVVFVEQLIKFVHVEWNAVTHDLLLFSAVLSVVILKRVQASVLLIYLGFVYLNSNYALKKSNAYTYRLRFFQRDVPLCFAIIVCVNCIFSLLLQQSLAVTSVHNVFDSLVDSKLHPAHDL